MLRKLMSAAGARALAALMAVAWALPSLAADVPYTILLDGRPLTPRSSGTGALARNGVVFVDVVVATKTFSGLLTFADAGNTVRLSIQHQTAVFRVGKRAQFDGKVRVLPGAPFKVNGDIYVPLVTVARLGGATLAFDPKRIRVARLGVRPFASMLRQQALTRHDASRPIRRRRPRAELTAVEQRRRAGCAARAPRRRQCFERAGLARISQRRTGRVRRQPRRHGRLGFDARHGLQHDRRLQDARPEGVRFV
jgi:hypothetical protein